MKSSCPPATAQAVKLLDIKAGAEGRLVASQVWKNTRMKTQFNTRGARKAFSTGSTTGCSPASKSPPEPANGRMDATAPWQTLLVDDLVIIQSEPGPVVLAEAKPDGFKELGRIPA